MKYRFTEEERNQFETDGYLIVEDALSDEDVPLKAWIEEHFGAEAVAP